ncbi:PREDICTED: AT-rich interactive domain-containing protein 4-like [Camelina sativa]|uniref:AT-rich interactive domain-containing protein 4-like n=1 Tax=Camelina sativa TaxID=90675 RepID=A0ABM0TGV5_CAMSA|nr:PREDICTED: AT-rich interactive domain-containing protein 4-like [Camelina sativa]
MMFHGQGFSRNRCNVVAVVSGENNNNQIDGAPPPPLQPKYPFPDLSSSGRLKIQVLNNPTTEEFQVAVNSSATDFVYLQGEQTGDSDEVGPLVLGFAAFSTPDALVALFGSTLPTTVYLELPNGEELAQALYSKCFRMAGCSICYILEKCFHEICSLPFSPCSVFSHTEFVQ